MENLKKKILVYQILCDKLMDIIGNIQFPLSMQEDIRRLKEDIIKLKNE